MFDGWNSADYLQATQLILSVIEILVTAFVAIWIVQSVQTKIDSEKVLKDFFSRELIQLRTDLRDYIDTLIFGGIKARTIKREHNLLRGRINDLLNALNKKFRMNKEFLSAYRMNLLRIIEADANYNNCYANDEEVVFSDVTVEKLHKLRTENDHVFNDILILLYESK